MEKTICLDFDGVVHSYTSPWTTADDIRDPPVLGAFKAIEGYLDHGFKVAIYSSRSSYKPTRSNSSIGTHAIQAWFHKHGFGRINELEFPTSKPPAVLYIDDRGFQFSGKFPAPAFVDGFQPWNKMAAQGSGRRTVRLSDFLRLVEGAPGEILCEPYIAHDDDQVFVGFLVSGPLLKEIEAQLGASFSEYKSKGYRVLHRVFDLLEQSGVLETIDPGVAALGGLDEIMEAVLKKFPGLEKSEGGGAL